MPRLPVARDTALPPEAALAATRRADLERQLDLMLEVRAPVERVRSLLSDLDRISLDLARTLDASRTPSDR
jgi:hypothetical protein